MTTQPPPPPPTNHTDPYQHWLDDAAQMGLMLYRMRNDSKRERIVAMPTSPPAHGHHQHQRRVVNHHQHQPMSSPHSSGAPPPQSQGPSDHLNATPRTTQALQTPTVATSSNTTSLVSPHHPPQPPPSRPVPFYLPLD